MSTSEVEHPKPWMSVWRDEAGVYHCFIDSTMREPGVTEFGSEIARCPLCGRMGVKASDAYYGHAHVIVGYKGRSTDDCSLRRASGDERQKRREEPYVGKGPVWSE